MLPSNTFKGLKKVRLIGFVDGAALAWRYDIGKVFTVNHRGAIDVNEHDPNEEEKCYTQFEELSLMGVPNIWEPVYEIKLKLPNWW